MYDCMTQSTLINLHPNKYTQRLRYYPFAVNLDRCVGSCNTLNPFSTMGLLCPTPLRPLILTMLNISL